MTTANISSEQIGKALLQNDIEVIMPLPTTSTAHPWHPRGWRGCLKDMQTLPLDLLFEVRYVHTWSLLRG